MGCFHICFIMSLTLSISFFFKSTWCRACVCAICSLLRVFERNFHRCLWVLCELLFGKTVFRHSITDFRQKFNPNTRKTGNAVHFLRDWYIFLAFWFYNQYCICSIFIWFHSIFISLSLLLIFIFTSFSFHFIFTSLSFLFNFSCTRISFTTC